jgi:F0F1-type ATP synthase membrane subunit c/vacuolar-type H+-ATPase subunit K
VAGAFSAMAVSRVNKPRILTYMILYIALVETAAIY